METWGAEQYFCESYLLQNIYDINNKRFRLFFFNLILFNFLFFL